MYLEILNFGIAILVFYDRMKCYQRLRAQAPMVRRNLMNFASTAVRGATLALILLAQYCATTYENGGAVQETSKAWHTNLTCLCEPVQTLESSSVMRLVRANYFMLLNKLLLVRELLTSLINKVAACLSKIVSRGNQTYSIFYTVCKLATGDVIK